MLLVEFIRTAKLGALSLKSRSVSTTYAWLTLAVLSLVVIAAALWANLQFVEYLPPESEFQAKWETTRALIFNGENPYHSPSGELFTSPLPVVLFYTPFALLGNYEIARAAWMTALQVATVVFAYLCIRIISWQINRWLAGLFFVFALLWFPAISGYIRGSEAAIVAALFTAALFALQKENDEVAGILLALAALQPRVMLIGIILVFLWAGSRQRWTLHFWAGVTFVLISGIGMIFVPSWPLDFFWTILRNVDFNIGHLVIDTTTRWWPGVGEQIGWGIVILAFIILIIEWWLVWGKSNSRLIWTIALSCILAIWIGFGINLDHIFLLLISLAVIFMAWNRRWGRRGQIFTATIMVLLLPGLWWAFIFFEQRGISGEMNPVLMIGFPFIVLVGLYWVRWWFLRPEYLYLNDN